jgi:hypothetical protein
MGGCYDLIFNNIFNNIFILIYYGKVVLYY